MIESSDTTFLSCKFQKHYLSLYLQFQNIAKKGKNCGPAPLAFGPPDYEHIFKQHPTNIVACHVVAQILFKTN